MSGQLITIEGIDGAGKSSVVEQLKSQYTDFTFTTEPDDTSWIGRQVRTAISNQSSFDSDMGIFFLFLADHANHVETVVKPALQSGTHVVCDRYIDSRYVYQSNELQQYFGENSLSWIQDIHDERWTVIPDVTILIDIPVSVALDRLSGDEVFERKEKLRDMRETYLQLADENERFVIVDGTQSLESVTTDCKQIIDEQIE